MGNAYKLVNAKLPTLKKGEDYHCIRYIGFGGSRFKTIVGAKSTEEARQYFEKYYPLAEVKSVSKGKY